MEHEEILSNPYIAVTRNAREVYIESFTKGMSLQDFEKIMEGHPEISITSHLTVKKVLQQAPHPPVKFGELKERIHVEVSGDRLSAYITLCVREEELNQSFLVREIVMELNKHGVVFGIKKSVLFGGLCNHRRLLVAEGVPPVNGEDSTISMYKLKEFKPEIKEDGKADYYEMHLINRVNEGEWLGERTEPTNGTPGKTVKGETLPASPGKRYPLVYDKNTVREAHGNDVTTLHASIRGAVHYQRDRISVSNLLEISENVDFKTGNIDFDGFLTIKGTVADNFSVVANKDVEILGNFGVGSVKEIESRGGSVYIKGGIAGRNKAVVKSTRNLYTKYVSDATILCEGDVHIGFYCLNSNIVAKQVIVESPKGQIIGGNIQADMRVAAPFVGNTAEKRTMISVRGFDRKLLKETLEQSQEKLLALKSKLARAKQEVFIYSCSHEVNAGQLEEYEKSREAYLKLKDEVSGLENELRTITGHLRIRGEGEISIHKKVYPNTLLEIKGETKEIRRETLSTCFYVQNGELKET